MPYNVILHERIMRIIKNRKHIESKKMFGGTCFLCKGNMFCGVYKDFLILRLGAEAADAALKQKHTKPFDITGRPMKGWVMVEPEGISDDKALKSWIELAYKFAGALPEK